jgi:hypothetical protein
LLKKELLITHLKSEIKARFFWEAWFLSLYLGGFPQVVIAKKDLSFHFNGGILHLFFLYNESKEEEYVPAHVYI